MPPGRAIPLPTTSAQPSSDAVKDDPTPQLEELATALSARVEAVTVAAPAAELKQEVQPEPASVEETQAQSMQETIPVAIAEPRRVAHELQETSGLVDNESVEIATEEICEIAVWRGYAKSRFYGRLDTPVLPGETELAVAESPPFRFRGNGQPDRTEAAQAAHDALVEKLVADGWELDDPGDAWYASRFRRPLTHT
jgi:hypothetical protein